MTKIFSESLDRMKFIRKPTSSFTYQVYQYYEKSMTYLVEKYFQNSYFSFLNHNQSKVKLIYLHVIRLEN